jgi:hypothetical protein
MNVNIILCFSAAACRFVFHATPSAKQALQNRKGFTPPKAA